VNAKEWVGEAEGRGGFVEDVGEDTLAGEQCCRARKTGRLRRIGLLSACVRLVVVMCDYLSREPYFSGATETVDQSANVHV